MKTHVLSAVACAALLAGCASTPPESLESQNDRVAATLAGRSDADSLAAAALMRASKQHDTALQLIAKATAAAPARADLAWLHVQICAMAPGCDPEPLDARLRSIDPANSVGWLGPLARASVAGDEVRVDEALAGIGRSERTQVYWTVLQSRLIPAVRDTPAMDPSDALWSVLGPLASIPFPPMKGVLGACKEDRLGREGRRASCREVARVLQRSDTYLMEMIGVAVAKRAWPADSAEAQAALEARRAYEYQTDVLAARRSRERIDPAVYLRQVSENSTEQAMDRAEILAANLRPDPPVDWKKKPVAQ